MALVAREESRRAYSFAERLLIFTLGDPSSNISISSLSNSVSGTGGRITAGMFICDAHSNIPVNILLASFRFAEAADEELMDVRTLSRLLPGGASGEEFARFQSDGSSTRPTIEVVHHLLSRRVTSVLAWPSLEPGTGRLVTMKSKPSCKEFFRLVTALVDRLGL